MEAVADDTFDERSYGRNHLCEASLRLLAALGSESEFPGDPAGIEDLLGRVATGRPSEPMGFAVEIPGELPRYTGGHLVWLSPAGDGGLRLRYELGRLEAEAVTLQPDGRLGEFESIEGFGVPDAELTERAIADRQTVERLARDDAAREIEIEEELEEEQRRFRTEHLVGARAAPTQEGPGPVLSFVVLYETGVIVYYLVPRPPDDELETDDPWADPLGDAMLPEIELADGLGTPYEFVASDEQAADAPLLRASQSFVPAVPADVERLTVRIESRSVDVPLGRR